MRKSFFTLLSEGALKAVHSDLPPRPRQHEPAQLISCASPSPSGCFNTIKPGIWHIHSNSNHVVATKAECHRLKFFAMSVRLFLVTWVDHAPIQWLNASCSCNKDSGVFCGLGHLHALQTLNHVTTQYVLLAFFAATSSPDQMNFLPGDDRLRQSVLTGVRLVAVHHMIEAI